MNVIKKICAWLSGLNLCIVAVCHLLRSGVAALFGPQSGTTSSHVQSICDAMEIPHIETRWDYRLKRDEYSVNLYPHPSALSKVSPNNMTRKKNLHTDSKSNYTTDPDVVPMQM